MGREMGLFPQGSGKVLLTTGGITSEYGANWKNHGKSKLSYAQLKNSVVPHCLLSQVGNLLHQTPSSLNLPALLCESTCSSLCLLNALCKLALSQYPMQSHFFPFAMNLTHVFFPFCLLLKCSELDPFLKTHLNATYSKKPSLLP